MEKGKKIISISGDTLEPKKGSFESHSIDKAENNTGTDDSKSKEAKVERSNSEERKRGRP